MKYNTLIFDLDNTLCECSIYYEKKASEFAEFQSKRTGVPVEICLSLLKDIDHNRKSLENIEGFSRHNYPRSFAAASVSLDIMLGNQVNDAARIHSYQIGDSVFLEKYNIYPGVKDILDLYSATHKLFIYTKGDFGVQTRKININGLDKYFNNKSIYIVDRKTPLQLSQIINDNKLDITSTIVIGDNFHEEIQNAIDLNIDSAFVNPTFNYHENMYDSTFTIKSVIELPRFLK